MLGRMKSTAGALLRVIKSRWGTMIITIRLIRRFIKRTKEFLSRLIKKYITLYNSLRALAILLGILLLLIFVSDYFYLWFKELFATNDKTNAVLMLATPLIIFSILIFFLEKYKEDREESFYKAFFWLFAFFSLSFFFLLDLALFSNNIEQWLKNLLRR